ncbi:hypothetical protein CF160_11330 [Enterococcus pseudoavium]|nr:hypothetical protein CF160_11330 [Enterococcus pseudoavium]
MINKTQRLMNEIATKNVVGYARTSSTNQIDNYSLPGQDDSIRDFCENRNFNLLEIIHDEARSGKSLEREGMQRILNEIIEEQDIYAIVVFKLSRLSRSMYDVVNIQKTLEEKNIKLFVIEENLNTETIEGRLLFNIIGSFSQYEGENTVALSRKGMTKRAELGFHNGNRVLGYDHFVDENGQKLLKVNQEEAKIIRQIYNQYERGHGLRNIANQLNQKGYVTKKGNPFSSVSIRDILERELYRGNISYNKFVNYRKNHRSKISDEHLVVRGKHEPIISDEQWKRVQYLRKKNSFHPDKTRPWGAILTGLLVCPKCGAKMTISNSTTKKKDGSKVTRRYYVCGRFKAKGKVACNANGVRVELIEGIVKQAFQDIITYPDFLHATVEKSIEIMNQQHEPLKRQIGEATNDIEDIEESIQRLEDISKIAPEMKNDVEKRMRNIQAEKYAKELEKDILEQKLAAMQTTIDSNDVKKCMAFIHDVLKDAPNESLKSIYHSFIDEIRYDKALKKAIIKVTISKQVLEKVKQYNQTKASIPSAGIDAFSLLLMT